MPWESSARPSLAIGLLVALARRNGFDCRALHLNLELAAQIGAPLYEAFAETLELFPLGEHVFAVDVFGRGPLESDSYIRNFGVTDPDVENPISVLRDRSVPAFLDRAVKAVLDLQPHIVGFSCTFNQVLASLALARRIKDADPSITILLGGACVHGQMGDAYRQALPDVVDFVFTGEADDSFVEWLKAFEEGAPDRPIAGVSGRTASTPARLTFDLDRLPVPEYTDFYSQRAGLSTRAERLPLIRHLPYESSRGCWWGEKSHCTFCGLNNEGMQFRRKSPERVVDELETLSSKYGTTSFMAADNILDFRAYRDLLVRLEDSAIDYDLFYEIKANVHRDDVAALRRAGVWRVQPGIESFSNHVLRLMRKGVTAGRNIQLLKWLREFGIRVDYNVLVGFPGETVADYEEVLRVMKAIGHLAPPNGHTTRVRVDRFSPFFDSPDELGIRGVRPASYYRHLLPPDLADASGYAYFFDHDLSYMDSVRDQLLVVDDQITKWKESETQRRARLGATFIEVLSYDAGGAHRDTLRDLDAAVFVAADSITSHASLARELGIADEDARDSVDRLIGAGLMIEIEGEVLTVVPFAEPHSESDLADWMRTNWPVARRLEVVA